MGLVGVLDRAFGGPAALGLRLAPQPEDEALSAGLRLFDPQSQAPEAIEFTEAERRVA